MIPLRTPADFDRYCMLAYRARRRGKIGGVWLLAALLALSMSAQAHAWTPGMLSIVTTLVPGDYRERYDHEHMQFIFEEWDGERWVRK